MAVAGNKGGAGGAKNIVRARAKPKRANVYVPPAALVKAKPKPLAQAAPQAAAYVSQGRSVAKQAEKANARQAAKRVEVRATSVRKRAKRVEVSAQRKRTGTDAPILVNRRANLAALEKAYNKAPVTPVAERQIKATGETKLKGPQPLTSKPTTKERKVKEANIARAAKRPDVLFSRDPEVLKKAGFKPEGKAERLAQLPTAALANAPKDVLELATTTPSSIAKLATTAVTHPKKLPGELIAPYKEFVKDPIKFATERPVTAGLMFAPSVKVPGLAAGRAVRVAGGVAERRVAKGVAVGKAPGKVAQKVARAGEKVSLERPAATLPGTTLRKQRVGSRNIVTRLRQASEDKANPEPRLSTKPSTGPKRTEIERRVDEFQDYAKYHVQHVETKKGLEKKRALKKAPKHERLSKAERKEQVAEAASGARGGGLQEIERRFGEEFGSHWYVDPKSGAILKPKNATEGHLHTDRAHAEKIKDRLPFTARVVEAGPDKWAVVPERAATRLEEHRGVQRSKALGAKLLKTSSKSFRGTVLPLSGKWLAGQAIEAGFRTAIHHGGDPIVGPALSLLRQRKVIKRMRELEAKGEIPKGSAQALLDRAASGGHFAKGSIQREELTGTGGGGKTLATEYKGTPLEDLATKATKFGQAPGARHVRAGWNRYQRVVFDRVNGVFEKTAQKALLGKEISRSPLLEGRIHTLSNKAIDEAARGLKGTEAQVELGRAVDRAYGTYSKFAPTTREMLTHNTPFLPWYINTTKFLTSVLPKDHPVQASLLASYDKATEEWRKAQGLSWHGDNTRPPFLLGTYPAGKDKFRNVGRYLPFAPGDPEEAVGSLLWPQLQGTVMALAPGVDWKGKEIKGGPGTKLKHAGITFAEAHVPGAGLAGRVTGVSETLKGNKKKAQEAKERGVVESLKRTLNPAQPVEAASEGGGSGAGRVKVPRIKVKRVKVPRVKVP